MISIISGALIALLEKELVALEPSAQQFILNLLGTLGSDVLSLVESKLGSPASAAVLSPANGEGG